MTKGPKPTKILDPIDGLFYNYFDRNLNSISSSKPTYYLLKTLPEQMPHYLFPQAMNLSQKRRKKSEKKTFSRQIFEIDFALEQVAVHGKIHRHHHHHWL